MQYMGGKSRIATPITKKINQFLIRGGTLVSLFCGSCSIESKLAPYFDRIICNDNHFYLIEMFKGVQNGYELPDYISEEQYKHIRLYKNDDSILSGFVGFGCSFGGKWFGGYARNKTNTNYCAQSKRSLLKDMATLKQAEFVCNDYRDVEIPDGATVYADPPYRNTTGYSNEPFDSDAFWDYMRAISQIHMVFISEQEAPDDFIEIWSKPVTRTLDVNKSNYFKKTEKLFIHKKYMNKRGVIA